MYKSIFSIVGIILSTLLCGSTQAQPPMMHHMEDSPDLNGQVLERNQENAEIPLEQVAVYWLETRRATYTDSLGYFHLPRDPEKEKNLVFHYISYEDDTVAVGDKTFISFTFETPLSTEAVEIKAKRWSRFVSTLNPINVEIVSSAELAKAACCNLSESFLTNSTVNVKESDGVSGAREIKVLGLAGRYTQILTERRGMIRGLGYLYGLNYIPGDWLESIQISKGAGSVANGYESMTGEINLEIKKPENHNPLHVNIYGNAFGRAEANIISTLPVGRKAHTGIYVHAANRRTEFDPDGDGFMNAPKLTTLSAMNRWKVIGDNGFRFQAGAKVVAEDREGGTVQAAGGENPALVPYRVSIRTLRTEGFLKFGWVSSNRPERSFGTIVSGFYHGMNSGFGTRSYTGEQGNLRVSWTWQDYLGKPEHQYRLGWSYYWDNYLETLEWRNERFTRTESVPGIFGEYTYNPGGVFTLVAGMRGDYHNLWGLQATPRLHLKFSPTEDTHLRLSGGRGFRTPNRIAENMGVLASSRTISFEDALSPEIAYTFGFSGLQNFHLLGREFCFTLDAFRTQFEQQLIVDLENPRRLRFYNLDGTSFSNTLQVELGAEVVEGLDIRSAYKYQDVQSTYGGEQKQVPFTPAHRGLLTLSYQTPDELWNFNVTGAYTGTQRIPSTAANPIEYQQPTSSPAFVTLYAQASRKLNRWEIYLGGENLTNYRQRVPVIAADDPFGTFFDSGMIWGPTMGTNVYAGLRYDLGTQNREKSRGKKQTVYIQTNGICSMCTENIENAVLEEPGVIFVVFDPDTQVAKIKFNSEETNIDALRTRISLAGYNADDVPADPEARSKLDACCR